MFTSHETSKLLTLLAVAAAMTGCTSNSPPAPHVATPTSSASAPQVAVPTAARSGAAEVRIGSIAFGRFDPDLGDFSLWTARADGSHQSQLTTTPTFFSDWAPDGSGLIFDYVDGANEHVAAIARNGSHRTQLTFGPGIQEVPRYSPDGRHVVFDASTLLPNDPAFTTDIWVMNSDGSHPRQVTHGGFDVEPVFSPDGRHIAFGRIASPSSPTDDTQKEAVYVVRTDGTGLRQVVAPKPALEHPRWSPDGRLLTFNIGPEDLGVPDAGTIFSVRLNGRGLHIIRAANYTWKFTKATWSPDGRAMLVVCHHVNIDYLCQLNPRTGRLHVVVRTPLDRPVNFPSWGRNAAEPHRYRPQG